ncbi:MAG: DoxX family protein, partial [Acidobacteria bacterium]|nr:DoxX family protein [Acidobacteriota bacterium]
MILNRTESNRMVAPWPERLLAGGRRRQYNAPAMVFPQLLRFVDLGLLLLRLMVALVFITSGASHVTKADERSKSIGASKPFTIFLGAAEVLGGFGVAFGVLTQLAALGLILVMFGAIHKKIFVWHTGFWGEKASG